MLEFFIDLNQLICFLPNILFIKSLFLFYLKFISKLNWKFRKFGRWEIKYSPQAFVRARLHPPLCFYFPPLTSMKTQTAFKFCENRFSSAHWWRTAPCCSSCTCPRTPSTPPWSSTWHLDQTMTCSWVSNSFHLSYLMFWHSTQPWKIQNSLFLKDFFS